MEFFEKLGNVANKTCKYTTQQTNRLASITKLKWKMSDYKTRINDLYAELGKIVYENNVREEMDDFEDRKKEHCKKIDKLADEIEECRKKILELNNKKQCPNCYSEIYVEFNYCPNCGKVVNNASENSEEQQDTNKNDEENEKFDLNEEIENNSYEEDLEDDEEA